MASRSKSRYWTWGVTGGIRGHVHKHVGFSLICLLVWFDLVIIMRNPSRVCKATKACNTMSTSEVYMDDLGNIKKPCGLLLVPWLKLLGHVMWPVNQNQGTRPVGR